MFAARLSTASARRGAAYGRSNWARSFSNTTPLGEQYDVVVIGKSSLVKSREASNAISLKLSGL
jgi:hypothetical protein